MNSNTEILQSICWALIHSVWQSAALYLLFSILSKAVGNRAQHRYVLATVALGLTMIAFCITVAVLNKSTTVPVSDTGALSVLAAATLTPTTTNFLHSINTISKWVDVNMVWIIRIWLIGSIVGMLRIASGVGYLYFLRRNSLPVAGAWEERIRNLAASLNINRKIVLAEARVSTPIVIGMLKPVVLFPLGLMSGLTTAQIEAILIHELTHIRRHDFIVNLFQCVMESLFFFNPFVWLMSSKVRMLREHCCDDVVIGQGVTPLMYVKTLAFVEEMSAARILAPAFTGQRYQLLNRMKRIMETSVVKREWGRLRLLPFWLALLGLVCASWLSIGTDNSLKTDSKNPETNTAVKVDTLVDESDEPARFTYRKHVEGDNNLPAGTAPADILPDKSGVAQMMAFNLHDSIPGFLYTPDGDWERFEKEFTAKFRKEFGDFFEKNREQYEKMMEDLRRQHAESDPFVFQDKDFFLPKQLQEWEAMNFPNPSTPHFEEFWVPDLSLLDKEWFNEGAAKRIEEDARIMSDMLRGQEDFLRGQQDFLRGHEHLWKLQEFMQLDNAKAFQDYEDAIVEQLVKDGYLDKGEKIGDLRIRNDEITVNGKKIKEKDRKKYQEIREKFEPRWAHPGRVE